jgi:SAM-dependent methyltransferase
LPFAANSFDLAWAIESFEHIDANQEAMADLARVLKLGGIAIVTTPTHWTWPFEFGRHGPHYYSRPALVNLISASGLQIENITPCGGGASYFLNLIKNWLSPVGMRVFRSHWWGLIDGVLTPGYMVAIVLDRLLPFPPTNWVVLARKKG